MSPVQKYINLRFYEGGTLPLMVPSSGGKGALPLHQHFFSLAIKWNFAPPKKKTKKNKKSDFGGFYWGKNKKKKISECFT
jgi:hypothetical protein